MLKSTGAAKLTAKTSRPESPQSDDLDCGGLNQRALSSSDTAAAPNFSTLLGVGQGQAAMP
jgi:hypothetical protein